MLRLLDDHLSTRECLVAGRYTVADVAVYAYSHVAHEAGIDMEPYPNVRAWFARVAEQPGYMNDVAAVRRERRARRRPLDLRMTAYDDCDFTCSM